MDEAPAVIWVFENNYPHIFYFICALHKLKNIKYRLKKHQVGEDYFKLL